MPALPRASPKAQPDRQLHPNINAPPKQPIPYIPCVRAIPLDAHASAFFRLHRAFHAPRREPMHGLAHILRPTEYEYPDEPRMTPIPIPPALVAHFAKDRHLEFVLLNSGCTFGASGRLRRP